MTGPRIPLRRAKTPPKQPTKQPPQPADLTEVRDELESACLEAIGGDPPGPLLASRLQRTCEHVLAGCGLAGARVVVSSDRTETRIVVLLPRPGDRVEELVVCSLRMAGG